MSSNITYTNLDAEFPVAGQDNDSQGFRDNFSIIKENFRNSILEIEDLQDTRARIDVENNYLGNTQTNLRLKQTVIFSDTSALTNGIVSSANVSFSTAHFHAVKAEGNITLTFTDWPDSGRYAEIVVHLVGDGVAARTVTFDTENSGSLKTDGNGAWTGTAVTTGPTSATSQLIKAWTFDGGASVYLKFDGAYS